VAETNERRTCGTRPLNAPHHRAAANRPDLKERRGRRLRVHVVVIRWSCQCVNGVRNAVESTWGLTASVARAFSVRCRSLVRYWIHQSFFGFAQIIRVVVSSGSTSPAIPVEFSQ
jgi:hypothetical protein